MSGEDYETPAVSKMGEDATFDLSAVTPTDVPYIGPTSDDEPPPPDHTASASLPPFETPEPTSPGGGKGRGKRGRAREPRPTPPKPRPGSLVKPLTELYEGIGGALVLFDPVCGTAVIESAPKCAEAVENLARENEAVRRVISRMLETSAWGGVLIAHAPIILAVAAHHGPREVAQVVSPLAATMAPQAAQAAMQQQAAKHAAEGDAA